MPESVTSDKTPDIMDKEELKSRINELIDKADALMQELKLQASLGKAEANDKYQEMKDKYQQMRQEAEEKIREYKEKYGENKEDADARWEYFVNEMEQAFEHIKNAFSGKPF